jgi:hypothetical protein
VIAQRRLNIRLYYIACLVEIWDGSVYCLSCQLSRDVPSYSWYFCTKLRGVT